MASHGLTATVVGGGLGGLAAAVGLRRAGWQVRVVERGATFGEPNVGVTVEENGIAALDALDLGPAVRDAGRIAILAEVRTSSGRWRHRAGHEAAGGTTLSICRASLHRILREALPRESLIAGAEVVAIRPGHDEERATVTVRHRDRLWAIKADLVVAADGLFSPIRTGLWPDSPAPVPVGATAWRGVTTERWQGPATAAVLWGLGAEFGIFPLDDGRVSWYGAAAGPMVEPDPEEPVDELLEVCRRFAPWGGSVAAVLEATDSHAVRRDELYELAADLPSYVRGRVALLGDAAHALPPSLGQGISQALEDAVTLSRLVAAQPPGEALRRYDAERRPRVQAIAAAARRTSRLTPLRSMAAA
ncbi:MAG: FAD-dependent monooxygenase [Actinomycetes bacterium]